MNSTEPRPLADGVPTTAYAAPSTGRRPPPRCGVGRCGETSGFRTEMEQLLQSRLRIVTLLVLAALVAFLLYDLAALTYDQLARAAGVLWVCLAVTVVVAALSAIVWLHGCLSHWKLRAVELILFGMLTVLFAFVQLKLFAEHWIYEAADKAPEGFPLLTVVTIGGSLRWFALIVLYGVFIPNTWRRCALVCGLTALTAVGLTAAGAAWNGRLYGDLVLGLGYFTLIVALAAAVAVFGAHRQQVLQREAFQAKQLGQYKLKRRLGVGGMGEVYEAEHMLLRRPCALKLIRPEHAGDRTSMQRFEREVQAMARLTHWNTVEVFDYGHADDGTFYYVMEYLPGQNLDTMVARYGPLPPARVVHFLRQVCRALREAHAVGLLHRDIKPSNIFASERGGVYDVAKLLDFGLVQSNGGFGPEADKLTTQGTVVGSPPFMSPEQAMGKSNLDPSSDIYSVGAVAYYLLTGQPPFPRETAMQMLLAHAYEKATPPSHLRPETPADLEAVVLGCLQKKPEDRFLSADSLEKALARCSSANAWTEEQAAAWWRNTPAAADTSSEGTPLVPTQLSVRGAPQPQV
jgi:serine/threonine-protein kinase